MIANLAGGWTLEEHPFGGDKNEILVGTLLIELNGNGNFDMNVPLLTGATVVLNDLPPIIDEDLRPTLSATWEDDTYRYGLRLVFDIDADTSQLVIVEGPLGSTVECWKKSNDPKSKRSFQPNDMGVITGQKNP